MEKEIMSETYIPKNLDECFVELNKMIHMDDIEIFQDTVKEDLSCYHHGFGTNLRNKWGLWNEKSSLYKYFKQMGIFHADDMSGIIMTSLWRDMHGKDLRLDEQVRYYKDYWKNLKEKKNSEKV